MRLGYRTCFHTLYDEKKKVKLLRAKFLSSSDFYFFKIHSQEFVEVMNNIAFNKFLWSECVCVCVCVCERALCVFFLLKKNKKTTTHTNRFIKEGVEIIYSVYLLLCLLAYEHFILSKVLEW